MRILSKIRSHGRVVGFPMCTPLQTLYSLGPVGWKCEEANCSPPIEKITKMVQYRMPIDYAILLFKMYFSGKIVFGKSLLWLVREDFHTLS